MKKILILHTKYRQLGGEDIAVENEKEFLKNHYDVEIIYFENYITSLFDFIALLININFASNRVLRKKIKNFKPDYVYIHNLWFKGSLGLIKIIEKNNLPVLLKIHNFRVKCTSSYLAKNHFTDDTYCYGCGQDRRQFGWFNKYFENSYLKSFFIIGFGKKLKKILDLQNLKIIALTNFKREYLAKNGIDKNKVYISRNIFSRNNSSSLDYNSKSNYLVYSGRISKEKGVEDLIVYFKKNRIDNLKLKIVGNGPDFKHLKNNYENDYIQFTGWLENKDSIEIIKNSKALITFTRQYEGQPTIFCEASLAGVPSIFIDYGGMREFFPEDYPLKISNLEKSEVSKVFNHIRDEDLLNLLSLKVYNHMNDVMNEEKYLKNFENILNS